mgnify:FL=1
MNAADFYESAKAMLRADGYAVHGPCDVGTGRYGYWFSWCAVGTGIEAGETYDTSPEAWASAILHRLSNSHIMHTHALQGFAGMGPEDPPEWGDTSFEGAEAFEEAEALYCLAETARNALKYKFPNS